MNPSLDYIILHPSTNVQLTRSTSLLSLSSSNEYLSVQFNILRIITLVDESIYVTGLRAQMILRAFFTIELSAVFLSTLFVKNGSKGHPKNRINSCVSGFQKIHYLFNRFCLHLCLLLLQHLTLQSRDVHKHNGVLYPLRRACMSTIMQSIDLMTCGTRLQSIGLFIFHFISNFKSGKS